LQGDGEGAKHHAPRAFAYGFWSASRPRKEEDLVSAIFPDEH
jgi:hypothetical protein